jgi:glycosyltransferase involved in cell wall biosynthesis
VTLVHDFIPDHLFGRYQNAVDVIALPYALRGGSVSSSMMACEALASGRPVIITDVVYFAGLGGAALQIPDNRPETIAKAVARLRHYPALAGTLVSSARAYAQEHSWPRVAAGYLEILTSIRPRWRPLSGGPRPVLPPGPRPIPPRVIDSPHRPW